jgi:peptidoglycan/xylan/chitin deacetylase (PgdA/CDA1 family)
MPTVSLLFHDVFVSDPDESGFSGRGADRYKLSVAEFEDQLGALGLSRRSGEAAKANARLTFDDGGVSFYTIAAPRLEACGLRAHCFVSTDFIGQSRFLTAPQIRELDARGHEIGAHSASHPARFSRLASVNQLREWSDSRKMLEDILGHAVTTGSVPGGYFSKAVARTAAEAGLRLLFNSEPVISSRAIDGCVVAGRFTIRHGARPDHSQKLVDSRPWARSREWAAWNAKGLVKPLLGSSYPRVADWIYGGAR